MKKILSILFFVAVFFINVQASLAASSQIGFEEALGQKKPLLVLIYAEWADNAQGAITNFKSLSQVHGNKFNYLLLDVAKPEMKEYNKKYPIGTDMPYVMMFKNKGAVMRYLPKSCVLDRAELTRRTGIFGH